VWKSCCLWYVLAISNRCQKTVPLPIRGPVKSDRATALEYICGPWDRSSQVGICHELAMIATAPSRAAKLLHKNLNFKVHHPISDSSNTTFNMLCLALCTNMHRLQLLNKLTRFTYKPRYQLVLLTLTDSSWSNTSMACNPSPAPPLLHVHTSSWQGH
jgi:hypothetical protein